MINKVILFAMMSTIMMSLGFTSVYADEIISVTVDLQTILLDADEIIPLLNTNNIANMSQVTISATLPCNSSNVPSLKITGGVLGNTTGIIDSSSDYENFRGPFDTCYFEDTLDASNATIPALNRIFLTNDGSSSVLTNLGTTVTLTGLLQGDPTSAEEFVPANISNLILWLDADDLSTITKDGSDYVSQWNDKSGNANHVSQATGSKQPLWVDSVQNSKPIIRFDGTDDFLQRTTFVNGEISQPNTVYIVTKFPSDSNDYVYDGGSTSTRSNFVNSAGSDYWIGADTGYSGGTSDESNILLYENVYDGASSSVTRNGTEITSGTVGSHSMNGITLGCAFNGDGVACGNPDIAEILVYDRILSAPEKNDLETYLSEKWGV